MSFLAKFEKSMLEATQATGIGGDNTGNITSMLWDFAAPTAAPAKPSRCLSSSSMSVERPAASHPG